MALDTGNGTSITFGSSSWSGQFTSVRRAGETRPAIDSTNLATTTARTFIAADLVDRGSLECDIQYDPDDPPPTNSVAETITLTFPVPSGQSNGATIAGTGFITDHDLDIPEGDIMTGSITIKWAADVTFSDAS